MRSAGEPGSSGCCSPPCCFAAECSRGGEPEIGRGPGYPLLLALGLVLGHVTAMTIVLQMVLSVASVYLVCRLALSVTEDAKVARIAATLYAVEPLSVMYCGFLLS